LAIQKGTYPEDTIN